MLATDTDTKRRIDTARDILVGKVPDPKSQVEHITIALIYKFMDDMDAEAEELGGQRTFFTGPYARYGWAKLMSPNDWLQRRRVKAATDLLRTTDRKLEDIAAACGFTSAPYFCPVFRKYTGTTPGEHRAR
jgi:methylphosphotriester-DNA--protein-cysteine methyltransferase